MKLIYVFLFFTYASITNVISAQVVVLGDSTPQVNLILNECGKPDTFTTYIRVASGSLTGTVTLTDSFLSNFVVAGHVPSSAIASSTIISGNKIVLTLNAAVLNAAPSTGVRIKYLVRAKCGANGLLSSLHWLKLTATGFSLNKPGSDFVSGIKAPTLIVEARANNDVSNAVIGNTYTRSWRIRNTGTNSEVDTIWIRNIYQQYTQFDHLLIGGAPVAPTKVSGDTVWYRLIRNLRNQSIYTGDTVFMQESFKVLACTDPSGSSKIGVYWGCFNDPICKEDIRYPATQIPLSVPNIKAKLVGVKYGCYASYDTVTMAYFNTGGDATELKLRFDQCYPIPAYQNDPDISGAIAYIDTASIKVKLNTLGTYVHQSPDSAVRYDNNRSFWPVTNPIGTVYLNRAKLKSGDTVYVQFRRYRGKYNDDMCQATEIFLNYHIHFKNNCGNAVYYVPMTNIAGEAHRFYGKINYNAPAYLNNGDTGVFEFTTLRGSHFSHFQSNKSLFMLRINLPKGLKWDGDTSKFRLTRVGEATYQKRVDSVYYNASTGILEAYYNIPADNTYAVSTKPRLYLDCSVPGAGGTQTVFAQYFRIPQVNNCLWQNMPYSCKDGNPLAMICPSPCPRGGVVPYSSEFRRTTFGSPDNNNDGIPDVAGSLDFTKIETNKLAPRDTFNLIYKGWIARGSQSPPVFTNGYARIWVPKYGGQVVTVSAKIQIKDRSTGTTFTVNNLPYSVVDTGSRRTIKFDFSNTVTGMPGGFFYDHRDSFILTATYIYNPTVQENANPDDAVTTDVSVYVSHQVNPTNDTAKYRCLDLPATYRVVNVYKGYNGGFTARPVGCSQVAVYSDYFQSVGDCCSNYAGSVHFPYEYRLFTVLDTVKIRIPAGYVLDSTRFVYSFTQGAGRGNSRNVYGITPFSIVGEWYYFLLTPQYTINGGSIVPSTTGSYWQMYNFITPSCSLPVGNVQLQYTGDRWSGKNTWNGITTRGVFINHNRGTYEYTEAAQLDISNTGATTLQAINKVAMWDVKLQNSAVNAIAKNTWLGFKSNTGGITVDSVRNLSTNALMPQTGGIFKLGNLAAGGTNVSYRLYAKYNACIFDSLTVLSGWTCQAYPSSVSAVSGSCISDSTKVFIQPLNPLVQTDLISFPPDPVSLCDTLNWVLSVSNRQVAAAYNVTLDVVFPAGGVGNTIIPSYGYKYPYNSPTFKKISPVNLGGGVYRFFLSDSIALLNANGLRPIDQAPSNEIYLNVRALTNCNFVSGSSVRFIVNAKKACNVALTPDAEFDQLKVLNAPTPKLHLAAEVVPSIADCDKNYTVRLVAKNYETAPSSANDGIWVSLPAGAVYKSGSVNFIRNAFGTTTPLIDTVGGSQRLKWNMNVIPVGDSTVFTIQYSSPSNTVCGLNDQFVVQTVSRFTAVCGAGTCNSFVENDKNELTRPVQKPNVIYVPGTGYAMLRADTTIGNWSYPDSLILSNVEFANIGNDTANLPIIKVFWDKDSNNILGPGETVFSTDTLPMILPSMIRYYNKVIVRPHKSIPTNKKIKIQISQQCNCTATSFVVNLPNGFTPLTQIALIADVKKVGTNAILTWNMAENNEVDYYELYKTSNGQKYRLAMIKAKENYFLPAMYSFKSAILPIEELINYEVVAYNKSGNRIANKFLVLKNIKNSVNIALIPNPANTNTDVIFISDGGITSISILDAQGKLVFKTTKNTVLGENTVNLSLIGISEGSYFVEIKQNGKISKEKLIIVYR